MSQTLGATKESLTKVRTLLQTNVQDSVKATSLNLAKPETALIAFRTEQIPHVLIDLKEQRQGLNKSRGLFTAISGLIPLFFCVLTLVTAPIALSGANKFLANQKIS